MPGMEKKYAILGDVHANIDALDAVLTDARGQGVTDYVCVGDVVGYGAAPGECLDRIRALNGVTVRGNHDHYCVYPASMDDVQEAAGNVIEWTRRRLSEDQLQWLHDLPLQANVGGVFMTVHSTLDMPDRWGYVFGELDAEASLANQKVILCFHGHTHVPVIFEKQKDVVRLAPATITLQLGRKYFINTGSVGQPRDRDARASYCTYTPKDRTVAFRRVAYPIETAQKRIREAGLPDYLAQRLAFGQ